MIDTEKITEVATRALGEAARKNKEISAEELADKTIEHWGTGGITIKEALTKAITQAKEQARLDGIRESLDAFLEIQNLALDEKWQRQAIYNVASKAIQSLIHSKEEPKK